MQVHVAKKYMQVSTKDFHIPNSIPSEDTVKQFMQYLVKNDNILL